MKLPPITPIITICCQVALLAVVWRLNTTVSRIGEFTLPPQIETKVIDGRTPFLHTFTVLRVESKGWSGTPIAEGFNNAVRGFGYVVQIDNRYLMLYSPHLQDLKPGAKIKAWFVYVSICDTVAEGKLEFVTPIELIERIDPIGT